MLSIVLSYGSPLSANISREAIMLQSHSVWLLSRWLLVRFRLEGMAYFHFFALEKTTVTATMAVNYDTTGLSYPAQGKLMEPSVKILRPH